MLTFCLELGRFLFLYSCFPLSLCLFACLSGDDTMRHDTYLLRWRLQNTTTEQIHENVVLVLMGGARQLTSPRFLLAIPMN